MRPEGGMPLRVRLSDGLGITRRRDEFRTLQTQGTELNVPRHLGCMQCELAPGTVGASLFPFVGPSLEEHDASPRLQPEKFATGQELKGCGLRRTPAQRFLHLDKHDLSVLSDYVAVHTRSAALVDSPYAKLACVSNQCRKSTRLESYAFGWDEQLACSRRVSWIILSPGESRFDLRMQGHVMP